MVSAQFDWDDANIGHIRRHGIEPEEVEQAMRNQPFATLATQIRNGEERILCAGVTEAGRPLQLV